MRPAGRLLDLLAVEFIEASVSICLQHAGEVRQVRSGPLTFAIRAIAEEHRRRIGTARRPIIAHVRPQAPLLGGAAAGEKYRHRGVIAVDLVSAECVAADRLHQRLEQCTRPADPVGEGRAIKIDPLAGIDLALTIQGKVIAVLGDQDMCEQPWACEAALNRTARRQVHDFFRWGPPSFLG